MLFYPQWACTERGYFTPLLSLVLKASYKLDQCGSFLTSEVLCNSALGLLECFKSQTVIPPGHFLSFFPSPPFSLSLSLSLSLSRTFKLTFSSICVVYVTPLSYRSCSACVCVCFLAVWVVPSGVNRSSWVSEQ